MIRIEIIILTVDVLYSCSRVSVIIKIIPLTINALPCVRYDLPVFRVDEPAVFRIAKAVRHRQYTVCICVIKDAVQNDIPVCEKPSGPIEIVIDFAYGVFAFSVLGSVRSIIVPEAMITNPVINCQSTAGFCVIVMVLIILGVLHFKPAVVIHDTLVIEAVFSALDIIDAVRVTNKLGVIVIPLIVNCKPAAFRRDLFGHAVLGDSVYISGIIIFVLCIREHPCTVKRISHSAQSNNALSALALCAIVIPILIGTLIPVIDDQRTAGFCTVIIVLVILVIIHAEIGIIVHDSFFIKSIIRITDLHHLICDRLPIHYVNVHAAANVIPAFFISTCRDFRCITVGVDSILVTGLRVCIDIVLPHSAVIIKDIQIAIDGLQAFSRLSVFKIVIPV